MPLKGFQTVMAYYKLLSDGRCFVRVSFGTGSSRFQKSKTKPTKRDAKRWVRKMEDRWEREISLDESNISVKGFLEDYLNTIVIKRVRTRTFQSYRQMFKIYIYDSIGNYPLKDLKPLRIQKIYNQMTDEMALSPRTVQYLNTVLKSALEFAVESDLIKRNPCRSKKVVIPKQKSREIIVLSEEEIQRFIAACREHPEGLILEFALQLGMRVSEYTAIRWQDIDLKNKTAQVNQSAYYPSGLKVEFNPPKTEKGRRVIPFTTSLQKKLRTHQLAQDFNVNSMNLVFPNKAGMPYTIGILRRKIYKPILAAAKIEKHIVLKNLRHTSATMLIRRGHSIQVVQARLGHTDVSTTLRFYSAFAHAQQEAVVDDLEGLFKTQGE